MVWGNCSSAIMDSLNPIHTRAARIIHYYQGKPQQSTNWLPISYIYKRRLLLLMLDAFQDNVPSSMKSLFKAETNVRSSRRRNQMEIPRVKLEVGKDTTQYRGPVIWNFLNRKINLDSSISKDSFKQIIRKFSKDINNFTFKTPMIVKKDDNFLYF